MQPQRQSLPLGKEVGICTGIAEKSQIQVVETCPGRIARHHTTLSPAILLEARTAMHEEEW